jgi:isochorismate pyruvate lyase
LVALLAGASNIWDAAARIKPSRDAVRDEWRKADVKAKVDAAAAAKGVDRALGRAPVRGSYRNLDCT